MAMESPTYPPIADYGLIGNCHTAALISSSGSIDWLCLPRFDSPALFCRILDDERGGSWAIRPVVSHHTGHQYIEHTNVLETTFTCDQGRVRLLDFMPVWHMGAGGTHHAPLVVVRVLEGLDGEVEVESVCTPRPDYARSMPDFTTKDHEVAF